MKPIPLIILLVITTSCSFFYGQSPYFTNQFKQIKIDTPKVFYGTAGILFDSAKYYFHQYNLYKTRLKKITDKIDNNPYAAYDVSLFRLEDSCKKYKMLLENYNSK